MGSVWKKMEIWNLRVSVQFSVAFHFCFPHLCCLPQHLGNSRSWSHPNFSVRSERDAWRTRITTFLQHRAWWSSKRMLKWVTSFPLYLWEAGCNGKKAGGTHTVSSDREISYRIDSIDIQNNPNGFRGLKPPSLNVISFKCPGLKPQPQLF